MGWEAGQGGGCCVSILKKYTFRQRLRKRHYGETCEELTGASLTWQTDVVTREQRQSLAALSREFSGGRCHGPHLEPFIPAEPQATVGVTMGCVCPILSSRIRNEFVVDTLDVIHTLWCAKLEVPAEEGRTHFAKNALKSWSKAVQRPVNGSSRVRGPSRKGEPYFKYCFVVRRKGG